MFSLYTIFLLYIQKYGKHIGNRNYNTICIAKSKYNRLHQRE
jgi:hypothetical protein